MKLTFSNVEQDYEGNRSCAVLDQETGRFIGFVYQDAGRALWQGCPDLEQGFGMGCVYHETLAQARQAPRTHAKHY